MLKFGSLSVLEHGFVLLQAIEKIFCICVRQKVAFMSQIMSPPPFCGYYAIR